MNKFKGILILALFWSQFVLYAQSDIEVVRQRVIDKILKEAVNDSRVSDINTSLREDGSWPGINYEDISNTGFQHTRHYSNMLSMSRAYQTKSSAHYKSKSLVKAINSSMAFWCKHDFICENWWHNQIGTPAAFVDVLLLMGDKIKPELLEKALQIAGRAHLDAPGARPGGDRIKIGSIAAKKVLASGDVEEFNKIMKVINNEIKFAPGDRGIQPDFSFHHRIYRVNNTTSYGSGYARAFAEWALYVQGTSFAFEEVKVRQLVDFYLDGISKQYIYGKYIDWNVLNRDVARGHSFHPVGSGILEDLISVTDYRQDEIRELIAVRRGELDPSASFARFYWQTEHFVFQRPHFYSSVRMYSVRNKTMEKPHNSEGLKNHHKADGANFISLRGNEYSGVWPVYDWQKIPGTTVCQKNKLPPPDEIQQNGLTSFVGAVSDGLYAAVAFDFISPHDGIRAHKSWFFFDEEYVCLGAGIESEFNQKVVTTLNQCLLTGEVKISRENGKTEDIITNGRHELEDIKWVHHDGIAYVFPEPVMLSLSNQSETGSWWEISKQWSTSKKELSKPIFKLWLDHGCRPQGRLGGFGNTHMLPRDVCYAYIVVPGVESEQLIAPRPIDILANNREVQAVKHSDLELVQTIFYKAGEVEIADGIVLKADSPGAIMLQLEGKEVKEISVADPDRSLTKMHFSISGEVKVIGSDILKVYYDKDENTSYFSITLPGDAYAGQSVTVSL